MENLRLELVSIITQCAGVKTFRFRLDKEVPRKPGQYLIFTLDVNGKQVPKAFSISSSPTEKGYIEFTKKLTDSDFSKTLDALKPGGLFSLRLPMGKFTFEGEFPKAAFLSGGIGITPIRSIFKYATDIKLSSSLVLLYSARVPEQCVFKNDFAVMQKENKNIKMVYTLTDCKEEVPGFRFGAINEAMVKEDVPDYKERKFFMCGPPGMVEAMRAMLLTGLGISKESIITEDFTGY
ncbi:MAG: FAD-binding oxidoreductase [Candidatus Omnitrophica bacterium]|nr:FAD-binding oxidoreductase [Candidatus Omnitrophota bacterium]